MESRDARNEDVVYQIMGHWYIKEKPHKTYLRSVIGGRTAIGSESSALHHCHGANSI